MFLRDVQAESPNIVSRWLLKEALGSSVVVDDIGGDSLVSTGSPTLGMPSLVKGDLDTCALGGYQSSALSGFQASIAAFNLANGVCVDGATARDPNGVTFNLFNAPGQVQVQIAAQDVTFTVWTSGSHALSTTTHPIVGYPQHVACIYDPVAQLQAIYVDGSLITSQSLSGSMAASTTGPTQILVASSSSACYALAQDVAVYNGALSANRIAEHFQAFVQQWPDPAHVFTYPAIGVTQ